MYGTHNSRKNGKVCKRCGEMVFRVQPGGNCPNETETWTDCGCTRRCSPRGPRVMTGESHIPYEQCDKRILQPECHNPFERGCKVLSGRGPPDGIKGCIGQIYFDVFNGKIYYFNGGCWTLILPSYPEHCPPPPCPPSPCPPPPCPPFCPPSPCSPCSPPRSRPRNRTPSPCRLRRSSSSDDCCNLELRKPRNNSCEPRRPCPPPPCPPPSCGPRGPKGERGEDGCRGPTGPRGPTGEDGCRGPTGPKGERGEDGCRGPTGPKGDKGDRGEKGDKGERGERGPPGESCGGCGSCSSKDSCSSRDCSDRSPKYCPVTGPTGPRGATGATGPRGPQGEDGCRGPTGPRGERGEDGCRGPTGATGPQGPRGVTGPAGTCKCQEQGGCRGRSPKRDRSRSCSPKRRSSSGSRRSSRSCSPPKCLEHPWKVVADGDSSVLVENSKFPGAKPSSSLLFGTQDINGLGDCAGAVLVLDSKKDGAFRAGVPGKKGEWKRENRGPHSVAFGLSTLARGRGAFAHGNCLDIGGEWNTGFGKNLTASGPSSNNFLTGSNLSVLAAECGKVKDNVLTGKCNTITSLKSHGCTNVVGGTSNEVLDSCSNIASGHSNKIKESHRNIVQGHNLQLEGVHDSLIVGVGHSNSCHTGTAIISGSCNKTGPCHSDGLTLGAGLTNNVPGVVLVGRNGEARNSPTFNYSFQLAGGSEPGCPGVGLVLHTASHGAVPVQNGIATGNWQSSCTGYSEYFEWNDGNPNNEDRVGLFVTLKRDKIELAPSSRDVIGVVTWSAGFVGNSHELAWKDANLRDDYERYCFEFEDDFDTILALIRRYLNLESKEARDDRDRKDQRKDRDDKDGRNGKSSRDRRDRKYEQRSSGSETRSRRNSDDFSERSRRLSDESCDYSERSNSDRSETDDTSSRSSSRDRSDRRDKKDKKDRATVQISQTVNLTVNFQIFKTIFELPRDSNFVRRCCERLPQLKDEILRVSKKRVNKINRGYKPGNYCPRSDRKEWETVTLIGRVTVRQNGSCREGERVDCINGVAVPGSCWRVTRIINSQVLQILYTGPASRSSRD